MVLNRIHVCRPFITSVSDMAVGLLMRWSWQSIPTSSFRAKNIVKERKKGHELTGLIRFSVSDEITLVMSVFLDFIFGRFTGFLSFFVWNMKKGNNYYVFYFTPQIELNKRFDQPICLPGGLVGFLLIAELMSLTGNKGNLCTFWDVKPERLKNDVFKLLFFNLHINSPYFGFILD